MVTVPNKIVYTSEATVTGGRRGGRVRLTDGSLELETQAPVEMGGAGGGANPEQLFAMGYATCFQGALGGAGRRAKIDTSASEVTCRVGIGPTEGGYSLQVEIDVTIPDVARELIQELIDAAHQVCPYSVATRGNIPVTITAVSNS